MQEKLTAVSEASPSSEWDTWSKFIMIFFIVSYIDSNTGQATVKKYQNMEPCIVDDVSNKYKNRFLLLF